VEETYQILKGLKKFYEAHHGVRYSNESLKTASELAGKYINDRYLRTRQSMSLMKSVRR
jgi:ATP-dependent Clp protease ATP-binding subunit ClpA